MKKVKVLKINIEEHNKRFNYSKEEDVSIPYDEFVFTSLIKIGLQQKIYKFITLGKVSPCAFLETQWTDEIPSEEEIKENILIQVYGELKKTIGQWEMEEFLIKQKREREEERRRKLREEKEKQIALGEQISIEKYLKNK